MSIYPSPQDNLPALPSPVTTPSGVCPICKGAGFLRSNVPFGHPQFGKAVACQCKEQERVRRGKSKTYTWLGLEEDDLAQNTFDSFNRRTEPYQQMAHDTAKGYASMVIAQPAGQNNLLFLGTVGVGKTHLATAILNMVRLAGIPCLFATAPELFTALYAADFDRKEDIIAQAGSAPLFCLDDIDKLHIREERNSDLEPGSYQKRILFDILNRRYRGRRPTIITTNAQAGMDRWLDEATQDRITKNALVVEMVGESQRRRRLGMIR